MKDGAIVHHCDLEKERRSNRSFVELEVTGDDRTLRAALSEIGAEGVSEGLGRWRIESGGEIPTHQNGEARSTEAIMTDVNRSFEAAIHRDPANWFWVHNRWKPARIQSPESKVQSLDPGPQAPGRPIADVDS
jgi:hypothetical protein